MLKIRRVHVANAGWTEAAFNSETLDLRSPDGNSESCVLHAENGTGKTTVLGLLFNILVPSEARFLPHLIKPGYKFTDYFQNGLSVIAVEWHDINGRHPVTLQFVMPQARNGTPLAWRRWALFRSGDGLGFDDLPLKDVDGTMRRPLRHRDDVVGWLKEMEARFGDSHGFAATASQTQWRVRLETIGIDTELAASQIEFNRQEGGIDSFLKISNERTFVSRFLALCLVTDAGQDSDVEPVCRQVCAAAERLRGLDELVDKRDLLTVVSASFAQFEETAAGWRAAKDAERKAALNAGAVHRAVADRIGALRRQAEGVRDELAKLAGRKAAEEAKRDDAQRLALACRSSLADLALDEARDLFARAEDRRDRAVERAERLAAARDRRQVISLTAEIDELEASLAAAEREIEEPKRRAAAAGTMFRAVLERGARAADASAVEAEGDVRRHAERIRSARDREEWLQRKKSKLDREDAQFEAQLGHAARALSHLRTDVLSPAEEPIAAKVRLDHAIAEKSAEILDSEQRSIDARGRYEEAMHRQAEAQSTRQTALNDADRLDESIQSVEARRRGIMATADWCQHVGEGTAFDSGAAAKASAGARHLRNTANDLRAAAIAHRRDADRIAEYKVTAVDANVDIVMKAFGEAGIKSAIPAAQWLADIVGDEAALRRFAQADPAGFAGIFVQNADELERADRMDPSALRLDRPVVVRLPHEAPRPEDLEGRVIIPAQGEAYDLSAAAAFVQSLEEKTAGLESEADDCDSSADKLEKLRADIASWLDQWGEGQLPALVERRTEAVRMAESAARSAAEAERTATEAADARRRADGETARAREHVHKLGAARDKVVAWLEDFGSGIPLWESRRDEIGRKIAEHITELQDCRHEVEEAHKAENQSWLAVADAGRTARDLRGERDRIDLYADEEPDRLPDLETARAVWSAARETWQRAFEDRLGPLSGELKAKREALDRAQGRFRDDHPDWASRASQLDADAARPDLERSLSEAKEQSGRTERELGEAKGGLGAAGNAARSAEEEVQRGGVAALAAKRRLVGTDRSGVLTAQAGADRAVTAAKEALKQIADQNTILAQAERDAQSQAQRLEDRAHTLPTAGLVPAVLPDSIDAVIKTIDAAVSRLREAAAGLEQARKLVGRAYEALAREARTHPQAKLEQVLIDTLTGNEIEAAAEDAERLGRLLRDRIATIEQDIAKKDQDRNMAVGAMDGLLHRSVSLFRSAAERRVPERVPRFGGQPVLKLGFRPPAGDAGAGVRRAVAEDVLLDIVRSGEGPASDHELAANLIEGFVGTVQPQNPKPLLGLRLLKVNDQGGIHHMPVAEFKASGGETLTSALLLYLLVARLRSHGRIAGGGQIGGALVLDNPLGKASNNLFLKLQLALAQAMDVQLIFTTAIKDWSAVGEFPQVIKFRKEAMDAATGRILVRAVKQWIGWPEDAAPERSQEGGRAADGRVAAE